MIGQIILICQNKIGYTYIFLKTKCFILVLENCNIPQNKIFPVGWRLQQNSMSCSFIKLQIDGLKRPCSFFCFVDLNLAGRSLLLTTYICVIHLCHVTRVYICEINPRLMFWLLSVGWGRKKTQKNYFLGLLILGISLACTFKLLKGREDLVYQSKGIAHKFCLSAINNFLD